MTLSVGSVRGFAVACGLSLVACGGNGATPGPDAGSSDAPPADAAVPRVATGTHVLDHAVVVGGLTADGFIVFSDDDGAGHSVAKVMAIAGGDATVIATSAGTGKADIRYEIQGNVVFAWVDRGNRVATLTVWSKASGAIALGANIRPGRASASADGALIAYERDITDTTATLVGGPIADPTRVIATANTQDDTCWRDTDIASVGTRLLVRFCPAGQTAFTLRSVASDGTMLDLSTDAEAGIYGKGRAVWRETGGRLAATSDGVTVTTLANDAVSLSASHDLAHLAYLTHDGAIFIVATDAGAPPLQVVAAPEATQLGALSADGTTVLYATKTTFASQDAVQASTDVRVAGPLGTRTLVPDTTSCPGCLFDSFSPDGRAALVLDPIDNTPAGDGAGPIRVVDLGDGSTVTSFGADIYTAFALPGAATGTASRFLFVDAVRDASLATGWLYGMTARDLSAAATAAAAPDAIVARGAENFAFDLAHARGVVSFNARAGDDVAGLWVIALP